MNDFPKITRFADAAALRARLAELDLELPVDDEILTAEAGSPLAEPHRFGNLPLGNRWCVHPMEGWDANADGTPSELTLRRWRHFGESGAKLIWGGEAATVVAEGRANPHQCVATAANRDGFARLLETVCDAHLEKFGTTDDLVVGLQLTHSGRFSRPHGPQLEPKIAYHHPVLDAKFGIDPADDGPLLGDDDIERLIDAYVAAAGLAREVGFQFVDVKACHGYLMHEFLSARTRAGRFGGDLEGRSRFLTTTIERIRAEYADLQVAVRLSAFDLIPYEERNGQGVPIDYEPLLPYRYGFGIDADQPLAIDMRETVALIRRLEELGVVAINVSAGSPYYVPHIQRPALYPPCDGYPPPEDPLIGVARQILATRRLKAALPETFLVGSGYSYLQEFLPHVAQGVIREGWADAVGLGRMVLSYPGMPVDTLTLGKTVRKKLCRTFSDCTTAPRNGMISGCFPLDDFYRERPEAERLKEIKQAARG
ncbi:MAG: NADH:flavin oxidoreductase [Planctomycetota bacterium]|nr:MAG: NADH:flavin oxidoreductase [Planctomycetota bacterium]REJ96339.1 MAG: NADH:flavin oxidoreductase [Planctomycetota bacterium]